MNTKMKQRGFIQIPLLIVIVIGSMALVGGGVYFGVEQYQSKSGDDASRDDEARDERIEKIEGLLESVKDDAKDQEIVLLRQELEELKKQNSFKTVSQPERKASRLSNAEIIEKVKPAVVYIESDLGTGSGMIIEANGLILTNAHVVEGDEFVEVELSDGASYSATVTGKGENIDLALLSIVSDRNDFPTVELGDSDSIFQGGEVFTLGFPFGLQGDVSFKDGTLSRKLSDEGIVYLEISAELHPGNSGGPLVNASGEVIGINTAIFGKVINGILLGESIKLAIPINSAKTVLPQLKKGETASIPIEPISAQRALCNSFERFVDDYDAILEKIRVVEDVYERSYPGLNSSQLEVELAMDWAGVIREDLNEIAIPDVPFSQEIIEMRDFQMSRSGRFILAFAVEEARYRMEADPIFLQEQALLGSPKIGANDIQRQDQNKFYNSLIRNHLQPRIEKYEEEASLFLVDC